MFGDPCPGTHKYLEAHYQCVSGEQAKNKLESLEFESLLRQFIYHLQLHKHPLQRHVQVHHG